MADMKALWHKIDPAQGREGKDWHLVTLFAADAMHALDTDGKDGFHWKTEKPEKSAEGEAKVRDVVKAKKEVEK
jgi:hypothetical protein